MFRLVFAMLLTAGTLIFALHYSSKFEFWVVAQLYLFPSVGLLFTVLSWLHWRRSESLRTEMMGGVMVYVWTDFSGTERRSRSDPRPDWNSSGSGGWGMGDSGGGDGGGGD